jgi:hypothetical protein
VQDGRVVGVNKTGRVVLGIQAGAQAGRFLCDLCLPDQRAGPRRAWNALTTADDAAEPIWIMLAAGSGRPLPAVLRLHPVLSKESRLG